MEVVGAIVVAVESREMVDLLRSAMKSTTSEIQTELVSK